MTTGTIGTANVKRSLLGYGGISGGDNTSTLAGIIGTEQAGNLATKKYADLYKLQERQFDTDTAQWEKQFAENKSRHDEALALQQAQLGLATGGGGQPWRTGAYHDLYGESFLPTTDQRVGTPNQSGSSWGGFGGGSSGGGGAGGGYTVNNESSFSDRIAAAKLAYDTAVGNSTGRAGVNEHTLMGSPFYKAYQQIMRG